jgi:class 3 adenylate cyclase
MEQQIRFCTSADGTRIAYAAVGQGSPVVRVLGWFTHLEVEWQWPTWPLSFTGGLLAQDHLLVRYDGRGMGLSDRQVSDFSLEAQVRDLEAVVDALGLERFALYGISQGGPTATTYAVLHPERVSSLILYGSFARVSWLLDTQEGQEQFDTRLALVRQGWDSDLPAHRQFFTSLFMPDAGVAAIEAFNELQRVSTSGEIAAALAFAMRDMDVTQLLPQVTVPTLVIHRRGDAIVPFESGRELATGIPGARLLALEGRNHAMLPDEPVIEVFRNAINEFLGEGKEAEAGAEPFEPSAFRTILFTDMEGSTSLTQQLGDAKAQDVLRTHNTILRDALKAHSGSETKHTGDGIMASFASASRALQCAIAMQRAFAQHNESNPDVPIRVRIGLNAGEPVAEDADLFGTAVQLAARICAHAEPGHILVPIVVRELAAGKKFLFADLGDVALRGFEDPVRLFELRWQGED